MSEEKKIGIQINDGLQRVPITNIYGDEIGVFFFRPTDIGILDRYNKVAGEFEGILKPLQDVSVGPDGNAKDPTDEEAVKALAQASGNLYGLMDYLFDGNMAEAFFGKMNPFSPVGGRFYCETVIEAVGGFIEQEFSIEAQMMSKNVEKYIKKYRGTGAKK